MANIRKRKARDDTRLHHDIKAAIDRRTLTVTECRVRSAREEVSSVTLGRYRLIDDIVWPTRLDAASGGRRFIVELSNVELNGELRPGVFAPPPGAVRTR